MNCILMAISWDGMGEAWTALKWDGIGQKNMSLGQAWRFESKRDLTHFNLYLYKCTIIGACSLYMYENTIY